jgi:hypothetical protein
MHMKVAREQFEMRGDRIVHVPTGATFGKATRILSGAIGAPPENRCRADTITAVMH